MKEPAETIESGQSTDPAGTKNMAGSKELWFVVLLWTGATIGIVLVWVALSTDLALEIAWLPLRLIERLEVDPLTRWRAWQGAPYLQALLATMVAGLMILISVVVGGWFRSMMAVLREANEFKFVVLPLVAAPLGAILVAAAEPIRRSFDDWPGGFNAFPAYFVVWALTLGYMMKLPWDCATELLKEKEAFAMSAAMKVAKHRRRAEGIGGAGPEGPEPAADANARASASDEACRSVPAPDARPPSAPIIRA